MGFVGKALEPTGMSGIGAPSMGNQMRAHTAVGEAYQVKPRCARRKGEVRDADKISVADAVAMLLQRTERTPANARLTKKRRESTKTQRSSTSKLAY